MNPDYIAERIGRLGTESAFEVLSKAKALEAEGLDVIHLEIGQPNFGTPEHVARVACDSIQDGETGYTASQGELYLREAIAKRCREHENIDTNAYPIQNKIGQGYILEEYR